ncbi:unnamed protein product, partial [Meganyctiphanes norvegica]
SIGNELLPTVMVGHPSVPKTGECLQKYQLSTVPAKLIMFWTTFWHRRDYWAGMLHSHARFRKYKCPDWRCDIAWEATDIRERAEEADAVIFFSTDFNITDLPPRRPEQLWIWMELEAPPISETLSSWWEFAEERGVYFNLSMSWHHLSDITITMGNFIPKVFPDHCPTYHDRIMDKTSITYIQYKSHIEKYDTIVKSHKEEINRWIKIHRENYTGLLELNTEVDLNHHNKPRTSFNYSLELDNNDIENIPILISNKSNISDNHDFTVPLNNIDKVSFSKEELAFSSRKQIAVWMASQCKTESRREDVIAVMQKYINVTTVGKCGQSICGKSHADTHCYKYFASTHLFYLSFENALCDDYITEKIYPP